MVDITVVDREPGVTTLSTEQVKNAAGLIKDSLRQIFSTWPEYGDARQLETGTAREFSRSSDQKGEGLWEVTVPPPELNPPYIECHLTNSRDEWNLLVQSSDQGPYKDPIISVYKIETTNEKKMINPPKSSRESLDLALQFVKEMNGGELPPELANLGGEKFV